jgi:hypothetical protein
MSLDAIGPGAGRGWLAENREEISLGISERAFAGFQDFEP